MRPTLIIDADDTLWESEIYYRECIASFAELMVACGFDREEAVHTADTVDRERVSLEGYGPQVFARNLVVAYERLCERHGRLVEDRVLDSVRAIGRALMEHPIVLLGGVEETLAQLAGRCRLFLLTKGDTEMQKSTLARSGLGHFFEGVHVVQEKDADVIRGLVAQYGLRREQTWMVGNSPRSDINPALEAGVGAVYIPHADTWELEMVEIVASERLVVLKQFGELGTLSVGKEGA
jgi:putative hydrolase of the HAD superfamily